MGPYRVPTEVSLWDTMAFLSARHRYALSSEDGTTSRASRVEVVVDHKTTELFVLVERDSSDDVSSDSGTPVRDGSCSLKV
jgi:hypothetical protein